MLIKIVKRMQRTMTSLEIADIMSAKRREQREQAGLEVSKGHVNTMRAINNTLGLFIDLKQHESTYDSYRGYNHRQKRTQKCYVGIPVPLAMTLLTNSDSGRGFVVEALKQCLDTVEKVEQVKEALSNLVIQVPGLPPLYVYLMQHSVTKEIKIGASTKPDERRKALQTGCDAPLVLLDYKYAPNRFKDEAMMQRIYAPNCVGGEWFALLDGERPDLSFIPDADINTEYHEFILNFEYTKDKKITTWEIARQAGNFQKDHKGEKIVAQMQAKFSFEALIGKYYPHDDAKQYEGKILSDKGKPATVYDLPLHYALVVLSGNNRSVGSKIFEKIVTELDLAEKIIDIFNNCIKNMPDYFPKGTFVYVFKDSVTGNQKQGISCDPELRVRKLQTGNPHKLEIDQTAVAPKRFKTEVAIHKLHDEDNIHGEWFDKEADINLERDIIRIGHAIESK